MRRHIYKLSLGLCRIYNSQKKPITPLTPDGKLPDFGCETNQVEVRKNRRRRFASGDRHAFNKHRGNHSGYAAARRAA